MVGFSNPEPSTLVVTGATESKGADKTSWRRSRSFLRGRKAGKKVTGRTGYIRGGGAGSKRVQRGEESGGGSLEQQGGSSASLSVGGRGGGVQAQERERRELGRQDAGGHQP